MDTLSNLDNYILVYFYLCYIILVKLVFEEKSIQRHVFEF